MKLTALEEMIIRETLESYAICGIENTEYNNTFGMDPEFGKMYRGAFASLKRKKILSHYNAKGCFNPIYPTAKLLEVCEEEGIEIPTDALRAIKRYLHVPTVGEEIENSKLPKVTIKANDYRACNDLPKERAIARYKGTDTWDGAYRVAYWSKDTLTIEL